MEARIEPREGVPTRGAEAQDLVKARTLVEAVHLPIGPNRHIRLRVGHLSIARHKRLHLPGLGLRVWGLGFRISGLGLRVEGVGFRV